MTLKTFLFMTLLAGCGYSTRRADQQLDAKNPIVGRSQKVFIPVFDNLTSRPAYEAEFTDILRRTLATSRQVQIVAKEEDADYVLLGSIRELGTTVKTHTPNDFNQVPRDTPNAFSLALMLDVQLLARLDTGVRKRLWARTFQGVQDYGATSRFTEAAGASSAPYIHSSREEIVVQSLGRSLSDQVLDQALANF